MFRIKFRPNRKVSNSFVNCFGSNSPATKTVMEKARRSILKYWYNNVYKYFDARISHGLPITGQLGRSLRVNIVNGVSHRIELFMVPLHNERTKVRTFTMRMVMFKGAMEFRPFSLPSMGIGRVKDYDYGKLLREGFGPSNHGSYDFTKDCKNRTGYHGGYDANTRWVPWMNNFIPATKGILADYMMKELKKMGIKPGVKPWIPQIIIP